MKRLTSVLLLLSLFFGCACFTSCDQTPGDVVIGGDELHPNKNDEQTPSTPNDGENNTGGEGNTGGENQEEGGIGKNEAVDLPFVPV